TAIGAGSCCVHPKPRFPLFKQRVKLALSDARLDSYVSKIFIELNDAIQATEINESGPVGRRHTRSIAPVFAATDRINRNLKLVGNLNALLKFVLGARTDERDYSL